MKLIDHIHGDFVQGRRARVLAEYLVQLLPNGCRVLDVGCGDGLIDDLIVQRRPDVVVKGIEPVLRGRAGASIEQFDGGHIPFPSRSFDLVMLIDVLHHTEDPVAVLREATRVAERAILVKDVLRDGFLVDTTLRFMDRVANLRYGVPLPYTFWTRQRWDSSFDDLGLRVRSWEKVTGLYPWPATLLFERSMHFVTELTEG
jgi:SAM-dependent methyltransferase